MKVDVVMPEMGESIAEGTIAKWLKKPGDPIERDEALLEITTDKIDSELPAPESGVLAELVADEGETVEVGAVLARIETDGKANVQADEPAEATPSAMEVSETVPAKASPVARNVAVQEGVTGGELASVAGSGHGGRVMKKDVLEYVEHRSSAPKSGEVTEPIASTEGSITVTKMSPMRKTIADKMVASKRVSPHTYTVGEVDMTRIVRFRDRIKHKFEQERGFKLTYTHFVLHATVLALRAYPLMNGSVEDDKIIQKGYVNLGLAVAIPTGLLVPVIKNAEGMNLLGLARKSNELAVAALNKKLLPEDVQGGTFTVTNPGIFGNIFGLPIINQPQLGILGVGAIKQRPVVIDDAIAIRSIMYLSLSYDHRVIDGALAAQFVQKIRDSLETYDLDSAI
jgi:2-oxoglutarate dehydrogenase E2 component (dihydrolipoamide succinyltransferase)